MARRSRTRWVVKWSGMVLCIAIGGLWASSLFYRVDFFGDAFAVRTAYGRFGYVGYKVAPEEHNDYAEYIRQASGWSINRISLGDYGVATGKVDSLGSAWIPASRGYYILIPAQSSYVVPLWMPLVFVALPTAFLWWRDLRRIPPGQCQACGYDLTGNISGRCPECGESASAVEGAER